MIKVNDFYIADPHFTHKNIVKFTTTGGAPLRPWDDHLEMDEAMIELWNKQVKPTDRVFIGGDFCMNRSAIPIAERLNGTKILIKGNHDLHPLEDYLPYFHDIVACESLGQYVITHIPIHPSSLTRWKGNIHGHIHDLVVKRTTEFKTEIEDLRYTCISAEHLNYVPIAREDLLKVIQQRTHEYEQQLAAVK